MKTQKKHLQKLKKPESFCKQDFHSLCDLLAKKDAHIRQILQQHGYPPMWQRKPNFETLIHIILEQQVSLASAKAALNRLKETLGGIITPKKLLALSDPEMKESYFSRQKIIYARHLATELISGRLSIKKICGLPDDQIRNELKKIKGIGDWTVDVFLLMALQRKDIFPVGDLAMISSLKKTKQLPMDTSKEEILKLSASWIPHRSIAAMIFWHAYIQEKSIKGRGFKKSKKI
jgi:DNA-3-methyladenine glycosylase II